MKRELLSIANASSLPPDYDAAKDLVELEKRNVRAAARAKYIKAALVTAALAVGGAIVANWQTIAKFFRQ